MKVITIHTSATSEGDPGPATIAVKITTETGEIISDFSEGVGNATSNYAAYCAVLRGLQIAQDHLGEMIKEYSVDLFVTNEFVKKQLNGEIQIQEPSLVPYFIAIYNMRISTFPNLTILYEQ